MGVTRDKGIYDYFDLFHILDDMNSLNFNIDNGYLEGLVRGFKAGILKHSDYANLVQCETLEGKYTIFSDVNAIYYFSSQAKTFFTTFQDFLLFQKLLSPDF